MLVVSEAGKPKCKAPAASVSPLRGSAMPGSRMAVHAVSSPGRRGLLGGSFARTLILFTPEGLTIEGSVSTGGSGEGREQHSVFRRYPRPISDYLLSVLDFALAVCKGLQQFSEVGVGPRGLWSLSSPEEAEIRIPRWGSEALS